MGPALLVCAVGLLPIPTCLMKLLVGLPCPACGLTRAGLRLLSLDVAGATRFQPLAVPLVLVFAAAVLSAPWLGEARWRTLVRWSLTGAGVGLVAVWALRFAGCFGGPVP